MTEYRWATENDYRHIIEFANHVFDPEHWKGDFAEDTSKESYFPHLLPKLYQNVKTAPMHRIAVKDGRIVGCVGNFVLPVKAADERLYVVGIGTVSTHPEARREGYMKALMADSVNHAKEVGADYMILGGQRQRYEHWGFEHAGINPCFGINEANVRKTFGPDASFGFSFRKILPTDKEYITRERLLRTTALTYTEHAKDQEYAILFSMGATPYVILKNDENGENFAGTFLYYSDEHGIADLRLTEPSEVLHVVNDLLYSPLAGSEEDKKNHRHGVRIHHIAAYDREMIAALSKLAEQISIEHCQMIRIINYERTLRAYFKMAAAYRHLTDGEFSVRFENGEALKISVRNHVPSVEKSEAADGLYLSDTDAVNLFFGNAAYITDFGYDLTAEVRTWFPLLFFQYMSDEV